MSGYSYIDSIDWDNMPVGAGPHPQYPALLEQIRKGYAAQRDEAIENRDSHHAILEAWDEIRFGVEQLTGDEVRAY